MKNRHLSIAMLRYQRVCPIKWDTLISTLVSDESMLELSSFRPMLHGLFRMWSIWRWAVLGTEGRFRLHCVLQLPSDGISLLRVHVFGRERYHRRGHEDLEVWTLGGLQRSTEHQWICWFSSAFQWLWARKEANCRGIHVFPKYNPYEMGSQFGATKRVSQRSNSKSIAIIIDHYPVIKIPNPINHPILDNSHRFVPGRFSNPRPVSFGSAERRIEVEWTWNDCHFLMVTS